MMAPATTAPPMTPAAMPGPHPHPPPLHPHPRPRHWAEASVAVAAKVTAIVAAASRPASVFFIVVSLGAPRRRASKLRIEQPSPIAPLNLRQHGPPICRNLVGETCAVGGGEAARLRATPSSLCRLRKLVCVTRPRRVYARLRRTVASPLHLTDGRGR